MHASVQIPFQEDEAFFLVLRNFLFVDKYIGKSAIFSRCVSFLLFLGADYVVRYCSIWMHESEKKFPCPSLLLIVLCCYQFQPCHIFLFINEQISQLLNIYFHCLMNWKCTSIRISITNTTKACWLNHVIKLEK